MGIYSSNFDFNKYRAFYAVSEFKSFSKAAQALHISQPAISYSIKELEEELGVQLFIRENKSVKLTDNGDKLLKYVEKAFNNLIMAQRILTEEDEELTGSVRIGIYSHISLFMIPKIMKEFSKKYPKVNFDIYASSTDELKEKLKEKELDFIILQYPVFTEKNKFTEEILCEMENCFFSSKKYYDLYISKDKNLVEYPIILPTRGYDDINALEEIFKRNKMKIKTNFRIYTMELAKKLVSQEVGIAWGLKKCIEYELRNKIFFEIPIDFDIPTTKFSISYDSKYLNKTALEFLKFFKKEIVEEIEVDI
ncbi:MAG: LysR family transcriptional regulator [bacterium]|nr:LysR family transcriptional regulator [bacterium]